MRKIFIIFVDNGQFTKIYLTKQGNFFISENLSNKYFLTKFIYQSFYVFLKFFVSLFDLFTENLLELKYGQWLLLLYIKITSL